MREAIVMTPTELNPDVGDMMLDAAGQEVTIDDMALETAQDLFVGYQFFKGEWILDLSEGMPYYDEILKKGAPDRVVRALLGQPVRDHPNVDQLLKLSYTRIANRGLAFTFEALLKNGVVLKSSDFEPFRVGA